MKKFLTLIALVVLCCMTANAQALKAVYVAGKVKATVKGKEIVVSNNQMLSSETQVTIPFEGKLELLDEANSKRIILKTPGTGSIKTLTSASGNSVSALSERYVAYMKKQMTNKGLTSKQRHSDFATVTREMQIAEEEPQSQGGFADAFDAFKKQTRKQFDSFRDSCNAVFIEQVRKNWVSIGRKAPVARPNQKEIKPVVLAQKDSAAVTNRFLLFKSKKAKEVVDESKIDRTKVASTAKPVEEIKPVQESIEDKAFCGFPFTFYGTEMSVRLDESRRLNLGKIDPNRVADALQKLSTKDFDNVLYDCLQLKKKYNMCDWAYLLMLKTITDEFCGEGTNEAALLMGYLYYQSGYKVKYANQGDKLYLLVASKHQIYDKASYFIDNDNYYPLEDIPGALYICQAKFPKEQGVSLFIPKQQIFADNDGEKRVIKSRRYKDIEVEVAVNKNLLDFYEGYPSSYINDDFTTRWVMYAEAPMNQKVKDQIYPVLKQKLAGLSELEAVQRLLNFVQTGLEYEYDDVVWGHDRAFFAEESLYYPYCDCEDRSVLLTRLVRDLVGLECALVYYPGHLASAVHFNTPVKGATYECNGKDYVICDATYINAGVGLEMDGCGDDGATLIPIK